MLFQSTPAFSGEGTNIPANQRRKIPVSIHPRLFRRGNQTQRSTARSQVRFQSTPAFSGEGTKYAEIDDEGAIGFNPPPPFQAREQQLVVAYDRLVMFQSTPAFSGEGTQSRNAAGQHKCVSIHPRLFRRGNANRQTSGSSPDCCLLYTSPSPRDLGQSRMPSSA